MELKNRIVKLIFDDGFNHFSKKNGLVINVDSDFLYIQVDGRIEAIPKQRIIRMEVVK